MAYATTGDVQNRMMREMDTEELHLCASLLEDAAIIIDTYAPKAAEDRKLVVSCRMVMRVLGDGADSGIPMGATQGSQSALGYSQSWTFSGGANGEMYLSKIEKQMLGINAGKKIGSYSPVLQLVPEGCFEDMP